MFGSIVFSAGLIIVVLLASILSVLFLRSTFLRIVGWPGRQVQRFIDWKHARALRKLELAAAEERLRNEQVRELFTKRDGSQR